MIRRFSLLAILTVSACAAAPGPTPPVSPSNAIQMSDTDLQTLAAALQAKIASEQATLNGLVQVWNERHPQPKQADPPAPAKP